MSQPKEPTPHSIGLTVEQTRALKRWHNAMADEYQCEALLEGQLCCVDVLLKWLGIDPDEAL